MATETSQTESWAQRNHFLIRRLHSLSGLVPLGVFLCVHLFTNATVLLAPNGREFQHTVGKIHDLPALTVVEVVGIFIPLAFHALLGLQIWFSGRPNPMDYRYGPNIRYTLQRATAGIALVFILFHVWQLHWLGEPFGGARFAYEHDPDSTLAARTTALAIQSAWWVSPLYAIGLLATVYHLANGIWTALITWGITIRPRTQRGAGYACAALGIVLAVMGLAALAGFKTFDVSAAGGAPGPSGANAVVDRGPGP